MPLKTVTRRIEEHPGRGPLGRHVHHDPRSRGYVAEEAAQIVDVTHRINLNTLPLLQKRGSCTAEALVGADDMHPNKGTLRQPYAEQLYDREIVLEGKDPKHDDPGGSGVMVCKAAQQMGLVTRYTHSFSLQSALAALVLRPVMIGSNWYDSMDEPNSGGLVEISPDAQVRGGHEYAARGIYTENQTVWFWNSWGRGYGQGGRFCMAYSTLERLLHEQGDVTVPYFN